MDKNYTFFNIIKSSFGFFGKNFKNLVMTMFVPVFLQIFGFAISVFPSLYLTKVLKLQGMELSSHVPVILLLLATGIFILCIGIWKYMLLMPSYCLACDDYDNNLSFNYKAYSDKTLERRSDFLKTLLWAALPGVIIFISHVIINIFCLIKGTDIAKLAFFLFIFVYTLIYIIYSLKILLVVQVFAFEPTKTPKEIFLLSLRYMSGINVFLALALMTFFTVATGALVKILSVFCGFVFSYFLTGEFALTLCDFLLSMLTLFLLPLYICSLTLLYKRIK